jgi:hypothetical protein
MIKIYFLFIFYEVCMKILEFICMHSSKNIYIFFIFSNKEFLYFLSFLSESLKKKTSIFNIGLVSYNINLQPKYLINLK